MTKIPGWTGLSLVGSGAWLHSKGHESEKHLPPALSMVCYTSISSSVSSMRQQSPFSSMVMNAGHLQKICKNFLYGCETKKCNVWHWTSVRTSISPSNDKIAVRLEKSSWPSTPINYSHKSHPSPLHLWTFQRSIMAQREQMNWL